MPEQEKQQFDLNERLAYWEKVLASKDEIVTSENLYTLSVDLLRISGRLNLTQIQPGEDSEELKLQGFLNEGFIVQYHNPVDLINGIPSVIIKNHHGLQPEALVIYCRKSKIPGAPIIPTAETKEYFTGDLATPEGEKPCQLTNQELRVFAKDLFRVYKEKQETLDVFRNAFNEGARL